jgi:hypothetical protein
MVLRTCGNGGRRKGKENVRNCSGKEEIGALALLIRRSRRSITADYWQTRALSQNGKLKIEISKFFETQDPVNQCIRRVVLM